MQGQGVAAIILLRSGPQDELLTELARSDIARRRDFVEGDCIPPIIIVEAAEVFLFKDLGDEVTLSTVLGWS